MKVLKTVIVDDEELARRGLELRLQREADIEICARCGNGREAIAAVGEHAPDLLFLDIQMPVLDGFATLREFAGSQMPIVIFVTAFAEHAIRAFEANALDYLLKPIDDRRLQAALQRVRAHAVAREASDHRTRLLKLICEITGEEMSLEQVLGDERALEAKPRRLAIKNAGRTACVDMDDIAWIESAGDYLCVHALGETHVLRGTMKQIEQMLGTERFARVHRSTIVNVTRVTSIRGHINGESFLQLDCGKELKVSRSYRDCVERIAQQL